MHVFIAGICGTFMAGIALIAREMGLRVSGCDANVYPPMSDQLRDAGIDVLSGYLPEHLLDRPDVVIIGNALSRGNPLVEHVLESRIPYTSGPQWLYEHVLHSRRVIAISGTHGKTTTSSIAAWLLQAAGDGSPGFLIGGIPANFEQSARLGNSPWFVIEADEYDTAFFDKRSKFLHYRPERLVINNIEYDHADIFPDLESIKRQFHYLVRTVPRGGCILWQTDDAAVRDTLAMGCWAACEPFTLGDAQAGWRADLLKEDGTEFRVDHRGESSFSIRWAQIGRHNVANALAALAVTRECGLDPQRISDALSSFQGVKRRLELVCDVGGVKVFDDFAHHPTAIETTLKGLRASTSSGRILAVIEPRSNTMKLGMHRGKLKSAIASADFAYWYQPPGVAWDIASEVMTDEGRSLVFRDTQVLVDAVIANSRPGDCIVIMSNGGFEGIHGRIQAALQGKQ